MSISKQQGFTLIEVILVIAISGALLMIAFAGQGQLRAQAQFNAAVNKVVSTIADAHNQANAGVDYLGKGTGISDCGAGGGTDYVFGGVAWVATPTGDYRMDFYKVIPQSGSGNDGCIFSTVPISMPSPIKVNASPASSQKVNASPASSQGAKEIFIRNNDVLNICPVTDNSVDVEALFRFGNCTEGDLTLDITDDQGRKGQVKVDKSGLARRIF